MYPYKKTPNLILPLLLISCLVGCQSTPNAKLSAPVIPNVGNTFDTSGQGKTKNEALMDAMHNAQVTCRHDSLRPVVITRKVTYKGVLDEETDVLINKVGKVIGAISGKNMPSTTAISDYQVSMTFKCIQP